MQLAKGEENGNKYHAFIEAGTVTVTCEMATGEVKEKKWPAMFGAVFGPDVDDIARMEEVLNEWLGPLEHD